MLILLPPSESKANRRRGRPADPSTWTPPPNDLRPEIRETRQSEESTS